MLTSMAILSGLVSPDMPAKLVARRKDIMVESAAYDLIKQEGVAEGIQKGIAEGMEKGLVQARNKTATNLLKLGVLTEEQIALVAELSLEEVRRLKEELGK
jgi:flagellar biosynthesis/type III secretory pathway protein FliH